MKVITTADAMPGCALKEDREISSDKSNKLIVIKEALESEEQKDGTMKKEEDDILFVINANEPFD